MTIQLIDLLEEKTDGLNDLKYRLETLVQRAESSKEKRPDLALPEFEAFGWGNLGKFTQRLEDALNTPLLEKAMEILESTRIGLNQQILEKLKEGLSVRRAELILILQELSKELGKINIDSVKSKAKEEAKEHLKEGEWDHLVTGLHSWQEFQKRARRVAGNTKKETLLYNAIMKRALVEGSSTSIFEKMDELEKQANLIGGSALRKRLRFEKPESLTNPLDNVEEKLSKIARKKEELRQIVGEKVRLDKMLQKDETLSRIIKKLDGKQTESEKSLSGEIRLARSLLRKRNNLGLMLNKSPRLPALEPNLKQLKQTKSEILREIERFEEELKASLSQNARALISALIDGELPSSYSEESILKALREIIGAGYSFEIRVVE